MPSVSGKTFATINPANGKELAQVSEGFAEDVDLAVRAAHAAFARGSAWRTLDASARGALLFKLADLVERDRKQLAALESLDNGKPFAMADAVDLDLAIKCLRYYAGWADKQYGKVAAIDGPFLAYTRLEAIGVVGQIIPWNFPLLMCMWKIAPALCCGNTVVLKPAEQTPLTALHVAALVGEAGFPPGVFNVIPGFGPTAGAALVAHPLVEKIAFTGSTEVGRIIQREAAGTLKRVTLELGGKSPLIVCADADIDVAVETAHSGIFFNSGQVCCASSRVFVHASIYDAFIAKSALRAKARTVGDGFSGAEQGPQVDKDQLDRVLGYIVAGKAEGATVVAGGAQHGTVGYFVQPTIFADVSDDMKIAKEEIFGPVMAVLKWTDTEEVIDRANSSDYGLAAAVLTKDLDRAITISNGLRSGVVWVNTYNVLQCSTPFGGYKSSGIGRELGEYVLPNYYEASREILPTATLRNKLPRPAHPHTRIPAAALLQVKSVIIAIPPAAKNS